MPAAFHDLTAFLAELGIRDVPHTGKNYLGHLVAVYHDLRRWGCDEDVCRGGLFHSIYGTERFQGFTLPLARRAELQALIGEAAERLAYLNCAMDRPSFDRAVLEGPPHGFHDRITGEDLQLSAAEFDDLCRVHLCDWLEQVPRCREWSYRREAYRAMAERLAGAALAAHNAIYSQANVAKT